MDSDDKDFQSQSFQLIGEDYREDSSRFPSVLRSFTLPTFDLDDSLHVHLRFDNLTEPGNLLGITGQEENNWIESFSTGSIEELNPNAAESCSISRNNNVWSEATSSESVEMLLKSIGEDDMMETKTSSEQPDADITVSNPSNTISNPTTTLVTDSEIEHPRLSDTTVIQEKSSTDLQGKHEQHEDLVNVVYNNDQNFPLQNNAQISNAEKPLYSEACTDIVGHTSDDKHIKEIAECLPSTSIEGNKHQEELSIDSECLRKTLEEKSFEHPHLADQGSNVSVNNNPSKTNSDDSHMEIQISDGSAPALSVMDIVAPEDPSCPKSINHALNKSLSSNTEDAINKVTESCIHVSGNLADLEEQNQQSPSKLLTQGYNELTYSKKSDGLLVVNVDQVQDASIDGDMGSQLPIESKSKPFEILHEVNDLVVDSGKSNEKDINITSLNAIDEVANSNIFSFHELSAKLVHEIDKPNCTFHETSSSIVQEVDKVYDVAVLKEKSCSLSCKEDKKQASEAIETVKPVDQNSSIKISMDANLDNVQALDGVTNQQGVTHNDHSLETSMLDLQVSSVKKDGSADLCPKHTVVTESCDIIMTSLEAINTKTCLSVTPDPVILASDCTLVERTTQGSLEQTTGIPSEMAHDGSTKIAEVRKKLGIERIPTSTVSVPSSNFEHINQLLPEGTISDNLLVSTTLPSTNSILSEKSFQFSSGVDNAILESCNDSQTASLHASIPVSDDNCVSTSGQVPSDKPINPSGMQNDTFEELVVKPQNEFSSLDTHKILDPMSKGNENSIVGVETKENTDVEKPATGDKVHNDNSFECVDSNSDESLSVDAGNTILSEHGCGSPNVISSIKHCHDERKIQENKVDREKHTQTLSVDIHSITDMEKGSRGTESAGGNPKENNALADDKSFTFEVGKPVELSEADAKGWKPFSSPQSSEASQLPQIISSGSGHDNCSITDQASQPVSHEGISSDMSTKCTDVEKARPCASPSVAKKWKAKEKSIFQNTAINIEKSSSIPVSKLGAMNSDLQVEGPVKQFTVEGTSMKSSSSPTVPASNLPDLNSSTPTAARFNQPFTDSQQVQLRAQIFVYGSLIQGVPPDEACMTSAFGDNDCERGKWECVWRVVAEKYENLKSPLAVCETPCPAAKVPDQGLRTSPLQSKLITNLTPRTGNKNSSPTVFSPILPSPLWSVSMHDKLQINASRTSHSESSPVLSTLFPYQSTPGRQYTSSTQWLTPSPPVPWVAPANFSTLDSSPKLTILPISRDLSISHGSGIKFLSPTIASPANRNSSISTAPTPTIASKEASGKQRQSSVDQKVRRRKKDSIPEAAVQMPPVSDTQSAHCSSTNADMLLLASSGDLPTTAPIVSPTHFHVVGNSRIEPKIIFSEETCTKIEQAKLLAENAASFAATAVQHSEGVWSQLANQKASGIISEIEEKLASAAVAAAAAAAVAKAASAAAKLAADSAVQAKLMADDAILSGKSDRIPQNPGNSDQCGMNPSNPTPASIIPAAREAARRRLAEATAATKKAENLDAIVKAAELAAEAVSQAGAVVAMGEPLPFSVRALLERGPEVWRAEHSKKEQLVEANIPDQGKQTTSCELPFSEVNVPEAAGGEATRSSADIPEQPLENRSGDVLGSTSAAILGEDGRDQTGIDLGENVIMEGSLVEVLSNVKGLGGVWYSARVLDLRGSEAYVCYNELHNSEGSDKIKEWISLDYDDVNAPRIRIAHTVAANKSEGPRKRRRAAAALQSWDIGDCVDAWITDGWREGIIREKSEEDLSKFIIHFPAGGDISVVRSWDLRPSLLWREGQWIEWSRLQKNNSEKGDTPAQKRQKISKFVETIDSESDVCVNKVFKNPRPDELQKPKDFVSLSLSSKERSFSMGKNVKEENNSKNTREEKNSDRIRRTGLQKEGSRVVFGIPRPGKKRKFMDVSKHCVVENTEKRRDMNESGKFTRYLMPQSSTGGKHVPKVDARSKRFVDTKPKVLKPVKTRNVSTKGIIEKGNSPIPVLSSSGDGNNRGALTSCTLPSSSHEGSRLEEFPSKVASIANDMGTAAGPISVSHLQPTIGVPSANKSTSDVKARQGNHMHTEGLEVNEQKGSKFSGKLVSDATEPRRSNRRIQPTSRLLEGLQSSLVIGKLPTVSHDKSSKVSQRTVSSLRGHARG